MTEANQGPGPTRYCKHYDGVRVLVRDGRCKVDVDVRRLVGGAYEGWATRTPCMSTHETDVVCEHRKLETHEDVINREREVMAAVDAFVAGKSPCCGAKLVARSANRFCSQCRKHVARVCKRVGVR